MAGGYTALGGHGSRGVFDEDDLEAFVSTVQRGGEDADVFGEAAYEYSLDVLLSKVGGEAGLVEGRVLVLIEAHSLGYDHGVRGQIKVGVEAGAVAVLDAVQRPGPPLSSKLMWPFGW